MWIVVTAVVAVVVVAIAGRRRAGAASDLGWVTERWLAVHRADQSSDSR